MYRNVLLVVHIACVAAWLGGNFSQFFLLPQMARTGGEATTAWFAATARMARRYYNMAGTLLAVYLLWRRSESLSAAAAIAHIRALNPLMIQSAVQEQFLVLFAQHLAVLRATPQESGA